MSKPGSAVQDGHVPSSGADHRSGRYIFRGGYSAGYHSYLWSEILDADAFQVFKETDLFDPDTARRFRESIHSRGSTRRAMDL